LHNSVSFEPAFPLATPARSVDVVCGFYLYDEQGAAIFDTARRRGRRR
jgi:hypothetical protein